MKRRVALTCQALALLLSAAAARAETPAPALDELLGRLAAHPHRHAAFTESYRSHVLDRPVESSGELIYEAPAHLEKHTLKPHAERMVLDGEALTLERHNRSMQTTLAAAPEVAPFVEGIRATLAGDRAALERHFHVGVEGDASAWTLALAPRSGAGGRVAEIRIHGTGDEIDSVAIRLANGDSTLMTLKPAGSD